MKSSNLSHLEKGEQPKGENHPLSATEKTTKKSNTMELLAQVSTLSWNLVVPIVGGVLLGAYLDKRTGNEFTWTLSLLVLGVMISLSNLYSLYIEHGQKQIEPRKEKETLNHDKDA
jgi:predicted F0F1-ATPase subunit